MTLSRRKFLTAGVAGLGGLVLGGRAYQYLSASEAKAKVVIVGGGAAGITMAAYLSDMLRHDDITIIEPQEIHHYQPGYTLVAGGVFTPEEILKPNKDLMPSGVKWLKDYVEELVPDQNYLMTRANGKVSYDFLVLAPGCQMNFDRIEGISRETLGEGNAHCIYDYKGAIKCHEAITKLREKPEGKLVFTDTYSKLKCGGAPKKITLMTEDYLRDEGIRDGFEMTYFANSNNLMTPAVYGDRLQTLYDERGVGVQYQHRLVKVDTQAKKAFFQRLDEPTLAHLPRVADSELVGVDYDMLHFTPPMEAPDFMRHSPLAITEGKLRHGGWAKVDEGTLIQPDYPNIVVLGDVAGLGTSKTGAAIRIQAPIAAANLVAMMEGKEPEQIYNGYTACPIVTEHGKVLMCEFGYDKELMPTVPFLDPAVERGMWWILKVHGLKPMYYHGMLKGLM